MTAAEVREAYLAFFESRGHARVGSDSLLPSNDPTLLFTSAGMVQFKPLYVAREKPYLRATSCQRCLRTTDIDEVGLDGRHLTFFEMLGNFSFGDYFKKETIDYAWEFLTRTLRVDPDRLHVTVYEQDDEAETCWKRHVPAGRITRMGNEDNYWPAGSALDTWVGPNGPCSEIHYDFGEAACPEPVKCTRPGEHDCDRFQEVWNLVFPQSLRDVSGNNPRMEAPGIDTGMGLERIAAVMQGKTEIYDTDVFAALMAEADRKLGEGREQTPEAALRARRIVADHVRAAAFMVSDGLVPGNEGRGYVLRRLIRRAVRQTALFGDAFPVVSSLLPTLAGVMGGAYPEIAERREGIAATIETEERAFIETLHRGLEALAKERAERKGPLGGERAFFLYDTFGFPRELTEDIWVREMGRELTPRFQEEYRVALAAQQERARSAWKGSGARTLGDLHHRLARELGPTPFVGYASLAAEARVVALLRPGGGGDGRVKAAVAGETVEAVLDSTPLYAEAGGQVADKGALAFDGGRAEVEDVQKPLGGMFIHTVRVVEGTLAEGARVRAEVDAARRTAAQRHHTATHLLHAALHRVVGRQATQAGSLVSPERLRFDFMSQRPVDAERLREIERLVAANVLANHPVVTVETTLEDAKRRGAMALFGEKYGSRVRLVEIADVSRELCGGTHVAATGAIGPFLVAAESAVASGVRRIEALAGEAALEALARQRASLERAAAALKCAPKDLEERLGALLEERRSMEQEIGALKGQAARRDLAGQLDGAVAVNGVNVLVAEVAVDRPADLRGLADQALDRLREGVVVIGSRAAEKCHLVARVSAGLTGKVKAGEVIKQAAGAAGGTGGGKPDMAQGGGKDPTKLPLALDRARAYLDERLGRA